MKSFLVSVLLVLAALPAGAAVFHVTKTADTLDGACDADCSLREAVTAANAEPGQDFVYVDSGVYTLTRTGPPEDSAVSGDLDVRDSLTILGAGAGRTVFDGNGIDRVFEGVFADFELSVYGATLRNGRAVESGLLGPPAGSGGGVYSAGFLTLVGCTVTGNRADQEGGGVAANFLIVRDSAITGNEATNGGGAVAFSYLRMTNVTVSGNRAANQAGGIYLPFEVFNLAQVTVTGNQAAKGGGLFYPSDQVCPGICTEDFSLARSVVAGNSATEVGTDCLGLYPKMSHGFNVFGAGEGCKPSATDRAGTPAAPLSPRLSPLGDHGGTTPTHALLVDSPAVDLAPAASCYGMDQRGEFRPADGNRDGTPACDAGAVELLSSCEPDPQSLCLGAGGRFRATVVWTAQGTSGNARAVPLTADTGAFWFFSAGNLELQIKVLDGCGVNQRFWVFLTGLTDAGVEVTVEDTWTGESWLYGRPGGSPVPTVTDTNAFATCASH
jgi:CSLREA domain-containing protein